MSKKWRTPESAAQDMAATAAEELPFVQPESGACELVQTHNLLIQTLNLLIQTFHALSSTCCQLPHVSKARKSKSRVHLLLL